MSPSTKRKPRAYRLGRRAETAAETRRRIVEATFALHSERGIADTSMTDIAGRAGVSVGTVYHHFASYTDAIDACSAYASEHVPLPEASLFEGAASRRERVARLARALVDYYERVPALVSVRRDRHFARTLDAFAKHEAAHRRRLAALAAGRESASPLVAALADIDVYRALRREGFGQAEAADRMAQLINLALDAETGAGRSSPGALA